MGWFGKKSGKESVSKASRRPAPGLPWGIDSDDVFVYHRGFRLEGPGSPESTEFLYHLASPNSGFRTNTGRNPVDWAGPNVKDLELDASKRLALLSVSHMPGTDPVAADGRPFGAIPGLAQVPWRGHSICGFSLSPDGSRVAVLENRGGSAVLAVTDLASRSRQEIAQVDRFLGDEKPQWSADGAWILLSTCPALVIDIEGRRQLTFTGSDNPHDTRVGWWPSHGPASVFMLTGSEGQYRVVAFDLASGGRTDICAVDMPEQQDLEMWRHVLANPRVSTNGDVLIGFRLGPPGAYQMEFGGRDRVALLNPNNGQITQLFQPFVKGTEVEIEHRSWSWIRAAVPPSSWTMAPTLQAQLEPCRVPVSDANDEAQDVTLWLWTAA